MLWIAVAQKNNTNETLGKRLCDAADLFRTNSGPKASEFSSPLTNAAAFRSKS